MLVWVIFPPDFDSKRRYPAILYCQGGAQSTVSQFFSYRWNFQLMAANDYIIVAPNRRGLPSFGQAWNDAIAGDWGGQAMRDYLSAIDDIAAETYVDQTRLGAVGASFGGYSVFFLAGHHEERFKALIFHGQKEFRVPVAESMQAFTAAQLRGVPSRFVYFPDESHWILSPQNGILWQRLFFDWLDRYLK